MGKLLKEFKEFAVKGNAVDMAVAVVIGGAFGTIVSSLVNDLIMPCIGVLIGGTDFAYRRNRKGGRTVQVWPVHQRHYYIPHCNILYLLGN